MIFVHSVFYAGYFSLVLSLLFVMSAIWRTFFGRDELSLALGLGRVPRSERPAFFVRIWLAPLYYVVMGYGLLHISQWLTR